MTNADCIRRMSDEQLYDFLSEWECGDIDYSITFCDLCKQAGNGVTVNVIEVIAKRFEINDERKEL